MNQKKEEFGKNIRKKGFLTFIDYFEYINLSKSRKKSITFNLDKNIHNPIIKKSEERYQQMNKDFETNKESVSKILNIISDDEKNHPRPLEWLTSERVIQLSNESGLRKEIIQEIRDDYESYHYSIFTFDKFKEKIRKQGYLTLMNFYEGIIIKNYSSIFQNS